MNDATFLKAICDDPADDVSRLAYADWLLEHGAAARGEFIQVQMQLAWRGEGVLFDNPADWVNELPTPQLKAREQALLATHGTDWARPIAGLVDAYQFRKGFVEQVTLTGSKFLSHAAKLFALTPLRRVRFSDGITKKLADAPHLARLSGLDFSRSYFGDAGLRTLLASPHLGAITWLDLSHCYLTNHGLAELADNPLLGQLNYLNLGYNTLGLPAVQALFSSPHWGKVRTLVLTGNYYIDSRAQEFLVKTLQGTPDPALLRSMLQMSSREEREYTNARVRHLAEQAGRQPEQAAQVLADGLRDGRRKVRAAAAQLLAQLGPAGAPALPRLVQRLFDRNPLVRDHVAPALARLLPELAPEMQRWLCLLANPLLPAPANLRTVLDAAHLPVSVLEGLAAVCARRAAWWEHVAAGHAGPAPVPEPGSWKTDPAAVRTAAHALLSRAGQHAGRHRRRGSSARRAEEEVGQIREAAWLLARITELLQSTVPPPAPRQATQSPRRTRRK